MRKRKPAQSEIDKKRNIKLRKEGKYRTSKLLHGKVLREQSRRLRHKPYLKAARRQLIRNIHLSFSYDGPPITIKLDKEIGLEDDALFQPFLDISEKIIDFNSESLTFDFKNSTRLWPSALTMLCSLQQWTHIAYKFAHVNEPRLRSTNPQSPVVASYLDQSGFYDYVGAANADKGVQTPIGQVVRMERPKNSQNFAAQENKIVALLKAHSALTANDIELFNAVILTESYLNVTEHGVVTADMGWWLICQWHPTHKFVSLCIADNGIGFRNSLCIGPQGPELDIEDIPANDGEFIKLACQENISGAFDATLRSGLIRKRYGRGAKRGNGLSRILARCKELKISLNILSHYGYLSIDSNGIITRTGARKNRIFAGTMYHFIIKGR